MRRDLLALLIEAVASYSYTSAGGSWSLAVDPEVCILKPGAPGCCPPRWGELDFIHIPKTAGTTIEAVGMGGGLCWGQNRQRDRLVSSPGIGPARRLKIVGGEEPIPSCPHWHTPRRFWAADMDPWNGTTTFCIKRHPFTRAISQYLMDAFLHKKDGDVFPPTAARLNAWVRSIFGNHVAEAMGAIPTDTIDAKDVYHGEDFNHSSTSLNKLGCHLLPQWLYILPSAKDSGCDRILQYESLDADFGALASHQPRLAGLRTPGEPAISGGEVAREVELPATALDAEARRLLCRAYGRDLELLGYATDDRALAALGGSHSLRELAELELDESRDDYM